MLALQPDKHRMVIINNDDNTIEEMKKQIAEFMNFQFSYYKLIDTWKFKCVELPMDTAGDTNFKTNTIRLNANYLYFMDLKTVKFTLLHELCHALAPNDYNHGREWHHQCQLIGIPAAIELTRKFIKVEDDEEDNVYQIEFHTYIPREIKDNDYPDLPW